MFDSKDVERFKCPVYQQSYPKGECRAFCSRVNGENRLCFRQSLQVNKFLVYSQDRSLRGDKDFLLITRLVDEKKGRCAIDNVYITGLEFRLRTVINLTIMGNEVNSYHKIFVDLSNVKVVDLTGAIKLGFKPLNEDYWEKYSPAEMLEEYKKLKNKVH